MSGAPVSFVIPAFNEEAAIPVVLESIQRVAKEHGIQAEYIVVDDGSTDQTAAVAATHGARVISIPMNVGYGTALKRGIEAAASSRIVITDADGSYPMDYTPELLKRLERFEALEQLRALWHGYRIAVRITKGTPAPGVDTQQDLDRVRALYAAGKI